MRYAESRFAKAAQGPGFGRAMRGNLIHRAFLAVGAAFAVALLLAPAAGAERGVVGYYQAPAVFQGPPTDPPPPPGDVKSGRGAAVNFAGTGGASVNDLYLLDLGPGFAGQEVNQYSANGAVKRAWGLDVVAEGPANADETQQLVVKATGGTFTLTFGGQTTDPIAYNAAASAVEAALEDLDSIGGIGGSVTVTGGPGDATGSSPYRVTFGGAMADANQPDITMNDASLTGISAEGWATTMIAGDVGFEICTPSAGNVCQESPSFSPTYEASLNGSFNGTFGGLAADQASGTVYVLGNNRVNAYSANGEFLRAFGYDAVASGPGDSETDEQQRVVVKASGGSYTLTFEPPCCGQASTAPIAYNAPASGPGSVEEALNAISPIGGVGGSVSVTGGLTHPGGVEVPPVETRTYDITFQKKLGGDDTPQLQSASGTVDLTGTGKSLAISTTLAGGAAEICTTIDACNRQSASGGAGGLTSFNASLTVAPATAPNPGGVLVADRSKNRVTEFNSGGHFVRSFGFDVVATGPGNGGGVSEVQSLTVKATSGTFTLNFSGATTAPLAWNASAAQVEAALNSLSTIGGVGGAVSVSGGPGDSTGSTPYAIAFGGALGGSDVPQTSINAVNLGIPVGTVLSCDSATAATTTNFQWLSNGAPATGPGAPTAEYTTVAADAGTPVQCQVAKLNAANGSTQISNPRTVVSDAPATAPPLAPATIFSPTPANPVVGTQLTCNPGAWTGATGLFAFQWYKNGVAIPGATSSAYTLVSGDTPAVFQCAVTGTNAGGSVTKVSNNRITSPSPGTPPGGNTGSPAVTATSPLVSSTATTTPGGPGFEICVFANGDVCQNGIPGAGVGQFNTLTSVAVDSSGNIYTVEAGGASNSRVQKFIPQAGPQELSPALFGNPGAPNGTSTANGPITVAIGPGDNVLVAKQFPAGAVSCEDGSPSPAEVRIQEITPDGQTLVETSRPCTTDPEAQLSGDVTINNVMPNGLVADPAANVAYMLSDESGFFTTARTYVFADVGSAPSLSLDLPSNVSATGASVIGEIDPNGSGAALEAQHPAGTTYRVEFKRTSDSTWELFAPKTSVGTGTDPVEFHVGLSGLVPSTEYEARVVVVKPFGFAPVVQTTVPFTTLPAPPRIDAFSSSSVTATSADLNALINPLGTETTYHFEYGITPAYGQSTPEVNIGDSLDTQTVQAHIQDLQSVVYHFRVVATNAAGTTTSVNQTFTFYPEPCPNAVVRQQTGSDALPDCRAYELASPGDAGTAFIGPFGPHSSYASAPSRVGFTASITGLPGPWNPPGSLSGDYYVASRAVSGWQTQFIGYEADHPTLAEYGRGASGSGKPSSGSSALPSDRGLNRFLQWEFAHLGPLIQAQVWSIKNQDLGQLPTNAAEVPAIALPVSEGGPYGEATPSADLDHYFYSSANVALSPDGLTSGAGSVYDNDTGTGSVEIASKLQGGADIPAEPGPSPQGEYLRLPEASTDGTHILMMALTCDFSGLCQTCDFTVCEPSPAQLYMRANAAITYDVSRGYGVDYEGMTDDGSTVYFTSPEQITAGDTDTSIDLFMWSEATDTVTRVSAAGARGNTDACTAAWIERCGVEVVPSGGGGQGDGFGGVRPGLPTDNSIASVSGDIYFYSPEQFVAASGIPGRRNLYVARDGQIQHVATLAADRPVTRIQVSPEGEHAAFISASQVTAYDNAGFAQMYKYNGDSGDFRCVSCIPTGAVPTSDVEGSQNGLFMTDDGRPFFSTADAVVPADTNNDLDVYEYTEGRARLITTGSGTSDVDGRDGLIGVTADGIDVYFSTTATLVAGDHNGSFRKIYDARTNGGFPVAAEVAPCKAADECHGAATGSVVAPRLASTARLGSTGNVQIDRCQTMARTARKLSRRAEGLLAMARRAARRAGSDAEAKEHASTLRTRARRAAKRANRAKAKAERCRVQQRHARVNGRAGR